MTTSRLKNFKTTITNPLIINKDPCDVNFYAIWTNNREAINSTVCEGIGELEFAKVMLEALNKELGF